MQILDITGLKKKVDRLREQGVMIPSKYLPANMEASSDSFRGRLGEIEVLELLANVFSPQDLEIRMQSDVGDVDIVVHTEPPHLLQVKDFIINTIRPTEDDRPLELEKIIDGAIRKTEEDIELSGWNGGTFTSIKIHLNNDKVPATSGDCIRVEGCNDRIHMYVIEVDPVLLEESMRLKIERGIRKAYSQLRDHQNSGIIAPVLNMRRYPHDQVIAYKALKKLFKDNPRWTEIGGVLMVTNDYFKDTDSSGLHRSRIRLIGIENPNADAKRRLNLSRFNSNLDDEDVHEESEVIFHPIPYGTPFIIKGNDVYVNGFKFGSIPQNLSYPTAVRLQSKKI